MIKRFSGLLVVAILGVWTAAAAPSPSTPPVDSVLASVNGEAITLTDIRRENSAAESRAHAVYSGNQLPDEIIKLRRQAVDAIIGRKLLIAEFQRLKLELPEQYVESLLDDLAENFGCKTRGELARKAVQAGTSLDELRAKARERIMADIVIGRQFYAAINPTPRELHDYFQTHRDEFSKPERVRLQLMLLGKNAEITPEKAAEELRGDPEKFAELTRHFSAGPNREKGGDVGWIENARLRPEFAAALPTVASGAIAGPIATEEGIYFLRVAGREAAAVADFKSVRAAIRKKIEDTQQAEAVQSYMEKLRRQAIINYYFNAPKTPPGAPAPITKEPQKEKNPMVTLKTNHGDIQIELFAKEAPETVKNFLAYVKAGYYNNTIFHRVIDGFMIQGGGFDTDFRQKKSNAPIKNEADNQLSNTRGTLAMARTSDPHSASSQFFINVKDNDFLDFKAPTPQFYGYCVFGKVVSGMEVVDKIKAVKTGNRGPHSDVPTDNVVILEAIAD